MDGCRVWPGPSQHFRQLSVIILNLYLAFMFQYVCMHVCIKHMNWNNNFCPYVLVLDRWTIIYMHLQLLGKPWRFIRKDTPRDNKEMQPFNPFSECGILLQSFPPARFVTLKFGLICPRLDGF